MRLRFRHSDVLSVPRLGLENLLSDSRWLFVAEKAAQKFPKSQNLGGPSTTDVGRDRDFPAKRKPQCIAQIYPIVAMGAEDQKEEREVLDSIFPEEITGRYPANQI